MTLPRKPAWLRKKIIFDKTRDTETLLGRLGIATVCQEARCPNISECFNQGHATFLILGKHCTRSCKFCHVEKTTPDTPDPTEPERIAQAVDKLKLRHVVITSVTRDDLSDGGASVFVTTIQAIRNTRANIKIELLVPDFSGNIAALEAVLTARPDILGHNIETVPRLYHLRPEADYKRSLTLLKHIKSHDDAIITKSAIMLGLGETENEIVQVLKDLRNVDCDTLAIGQYLQPSHHHVPVVRFVLPAEFDSFKTLALSLGFSHVESGPYVRSSYRAASYL